MSSYKPTSLTVASKSNLELNCNDKLIRDEVKVLNKKNGVLPAYCFTEEQAKEIVKRCKFKCIVTFGDGIYVIKKDKRWTSYERI